MKILNLSLRNFGILILLNLCLIALLFFAFKVKNKILKALFFTAYFVALGICYFYFSNFQIILIYIIFPSLFFSGLAYFWIYEEKPDDLWDVLIKTDKGNKYIRGIQRGVAVFGAAGSGKTISVIYPILKHFAERNFGGVIYDFKDGELTDLAVPLFKEKLKVIAVHRPSSSARVNPIEPKYISGEKDVNEIVSVLMDNLINNGIGKGDDFFKESASSLLSAVILKFWLDHRFYCTLPHIISFILGLDFAMETKAKDRSLGEEAQNKFGKLRDFLAKDERVAIQASPFLLGLGSERQTASVLSTLSNALRKISFPEAFWVLSGHDVHFDVNSKENLSVISIVNEPKSSKFLSPINATIIHTITKQMMIKDREPSFLLLDEAPTLKLLNMAQIPATMRSFGVAVVYCAQDIVQGTVQYGKEGFKEIIANLSTQFFGKSNDPDTSAFYERYFEKIKEKTKSTSQKGDLFSSGKTLTVGEREVSKFRASQFHNLQVGEFAMLSGKVNHIFHLQALNAKSEIPDNHKIVTEQMLLKNFKKIVNEVKILIP